MFALKNFHSTMHIPPNSIPLNVKSTVKYSVPKHRDTDCPQICTSVIGNLGWKRESYQSRIMDITSDGRVLAYYLKSIKGSVVRLLKLDLMCRCHLPQASDCVSDMEWCSYPHAYLLGITDTNRSVTFYKVEKDRELEQKCELLKILSNNPQKDVAVRCSLTWCRGLSEKLITPQVLEFVENYFKVAVWFENVLYIFNVKKICKEFGSKTSYDAIESKICKITENKNIASAQISVDGSTLCLSSEDGQLKFFKLGKPQDTHCIRTFQACGSDPLSWSYFFTDSSMFTSNLPKNAGYVFIAAENNRVISLWNPAESNMTSCLKQVCLLIGENNPKDTTPFVLCVDKNGKFLCISDIANKLLFIVALEELKNSFYMRVLSVFPLVKPLLFIAVAEFKCITEARSTLAVGERLVRAEIYAINDQSLVKLVINYDEKGEANLEQKLCDVKIELLSEMPNENKRKTKPQPVQAIPPVKVENQTAVVPDEKKSNNESKKIVNTMDEQGDLLKQLKSMMESQRSTMSSVLLKMEQIDLQMRHMTNSNIKLVKPASNYEDLLSLISERRYSILFARVLTANTADELNYVCDVLEPWDIFSGSQSTFVISHIAVLMIAVSKTLAVSTENKFKYVQAMLVAMSRDALDEGNRHAVLVLKKMLTIYTEEESNPVAQRCVANVLLMACEHLLSK
ncbi:Enhancer of mRNA-decapping protein 4 -like protein [Trichinella pseudospiralis]|uniref:Enhancer of mRNA-decapping protein 4-like protein n=1 Tax=Trichinella pseudospiralis TaxID=6337 RepID=A0A0V1FD47_TRIPS|nr:Enhancer of mRNA-decapping protein 4 -like protein [Trichinella pseudospiralis]